MNEVMATNTRIALCLVLLISAGCSQEGVQQSELNVTDQLETVDKVIADGPFEPTWDSLKGF